ncbi:hypothetical protein [Corynebacterium sp.]|uniref:hypothetical protein n=1 Tax=Corynebacterium sp. TaxID=1720 RepID=UPI0025BFA486|nr:hypothetical protein [Corynebacterium sp.]
MTTVFGIHPSQVRDTARGLEVQASAVEETAGTLPAAVPQAAALPGGRTVAALAEGARRVADAVGGEARVLEVIGGDLRSFSRAVESAELDAAASLSTPAQDAQRGGR